MDARPDAGVRRARRLPYKGAERRAITIAGHDQITDATPTAARNNDARIIPLVCAAHFVSHFYILVLPPLFPFIREFYGVSYTELGFALTAFNVTTALCQTPAGFLVDRVGARSVLVAGLVLGAVCLAVVGLDPVVLAAGRDVRAVRRRERRLPPGRLRDPVAARLDRARRPGLLAAHLRGLPRHRGRARPHADPAAGARLAGRVPRRLRDGPAGRDRAHAAAAPRCSTPPPKPGAGRRASRRTRPAGRCCCRRRSCSISCSS